MERPLRSRVWFYKPEWYWFGPATLSPVMRGGDEFNWHTIVLGWSILGRMVIATRPCDGSGRCAADLADPDMKPEWISASDWPVDCYGHNHVLCDAPDCYCKVES